MAGINSKKYDTSSVGGKAPSTKAKVVKAPTLMSTLRKGATKARKAVVKATGGDMASVKKRMAKTAKAKAVANVKAKAKIAAAGVKLKKKAIDKAVIPGERKKRALRKLR